MGALLCLCMPWPGYLHQRAVRGPYPGQSCGIAGLGGVRGSRQGERAGRCALAGQGITGHCADEDAGEQGVKTLASKVSRRERASCEVQAVLAGVGE